MQTCVLKVCSKGIVWNMDTFSPGQCIHTKVYYMQLCAGKAHMIAGSNFAQIRLRKVPVSLLLSPPHSQVCSDTGNGARRQSELNFLCFCKATVVDKLVWWGHGSVGNDGISYKKCRKRYARLRRQKHCADSQHAWAQLDWCQNVMSTWIFSDI